MELKKIPAIWSELVKSWKAIKDYLTSIAPTQKMQGAKNKVAISRFLADHHWLQHHTVILEVVILMR